MTVGSSFWSVTQGHKTSNPQAESETSVSVFCFGFQFDLSATSYGGRDSIPDMLVSPRIALVKKKIKKGYLKIFVFKGIGLKVEKENREV